MKNQWIFLIFILCLTIGLQFSYGLFRGHYSDEKELQAALHALREQGERQELRRAMLEGRIQDLQASVYQTLGGKKALTWVEKQWWTSLRGPASVGPIKVEGAALLAKAKEEFREKDYQAAVDSLKSHIARYPTSRDVIEAHFLLAEALYLSGQPEASLDLIDQMMSRYPESELTGFIMLRMGQILEKRNRREEAREVYRTVLDQFPRSADLRRQAQALVKE